MPSADSLGLTVKWVLLPNGMSADGQELLFSAYAALALAGDDAGGPPTLADYPDLLDWPATVAGMDFGVEFDGNGQRVPARLLPGELLDRGLADGLRAHDDGGPVPAGGPDPTAGDDLLRDHRAAESAPLVRTDGGGFDRRPAADRALRAVAGRRRPAVRRYRGGAAAAGAPLAAGWRRVARRHVAHAGGRRHHPGRQPHRHDRGAAAGRGSGRRSRPRGRVPHRAGTAAGRRPRRPSSRPRTGRRCTTRWTSTRSSPA